MITSGPRMQRGTHQRQIAVCTWIQCSTAIGSHRLRFYCPRIPRSLHVAAAATIAKNGLRRIGAEKWVPKNGCRKTTDEVAAVVWDLVRGGTPFCLQLTAKQYGIQLFYQLNQPFRVVLAAGRFGEFAPILNWSFHRSPH